MFAKTHKFTFFQKNDYLHYLQCLAHHKKDMICIIVIMLPLYIDEFLYKTLQIIPDFWYIVKGKWKSSYFIEKEGHDSSN